MGQTASSIQAGTVAAKLRFVNCNDPLVSKTWQDVAEQDLFTFFSAYRSVHA